MKGSVFHSIPLRIFNKKRQTVKGSHIGDVRYQLTRKIAHSAPASQGVVGGRIVKKLGLPSVLHKKESGKAGSE